MTLTAPPSLIALTPGDLTTARADQLVPQLIPRLAGAVRAGLRGLLLREPELEDRAYLELARTCARVLAPVSGWLGLHDRAHLVGEVGAQGLHLGFQSLKPLHARHVVGDGVALGLSTHAGDDPDDWAACDYRFFGPVLDTPSKRGLVQPTGFDLLEEACAASACPLWALGGITPAEVKPALAAGASGVAVRAGVLGAEDPAAAVGAYLEALA